MPKCYNFVKSILFDDGEILLALGFTAFAFYCCSYADLNYELFYNLELFKLEAKLLFFSSPAYTIFDYINTSPTSCPSFIKITFFDGFYPINWSVPSACIIYSL